MVSAIKCISHSIIFYNLIMDSPNFDSNSPFGSYQNNWILPEELIISSQPSLFLLDMEKEMKGEGILAVKQAKKGRGEQMDSVMTTEKKVQLKKKVVKQVEKVKAAQKTVVKQTEKEKAAQIENAKVPRKEMIKINEHARGEKAVVETEKTETEKNNVDAVATSFEQVKNYFSSIIEIDESALKILCKEKGIIPKGRPSMKQKYAFALFCDALKELEM